MLNEEVWVQLLGVQGPRAHVIFVLRECIWTAPLVSLLLPAFNDTGSLGYPQFRLVYPIGFGPGDFLPFPCGK